MRSRLTPIESLVLALAVAAVAIATAVAIAVLRGVPSAAGAVHARIPPGVVDVDTNLAYEGAAAAGTGIVLPARGEVLTNNHVVRGATAIRVTDVATGRHYLATVAGYDVTADIALLKLEGAPRLKPAPIGDSATVRLGDHVTAVGNAGGVGGTPSETSGRVTGLHQAITVSDDHGGEEHLHGLIRASAPLQPGDSGGPLLDTGGQVIGIDTAASFGFTFQQQGDGFAIPIGEALSIARQIAAGRSSATVHVGPTAFLGVDVAAQGGGVPGLDVAGALVQGVIPGSAADKAQLAPGDVITAFDGHTVSSATSLTGLLLHTVPGAKVQIRWLDPTGSAHTSSVRPAAGPPQ